MVDLRVIFVGELNMDHRGGNGLVTIMRWESGMRAPLSRGLVSIACALFAAVCVSKDFTSAEDSPPRINPEREAPRSADARGLSVVRTRPGSTAAVRKRLEDRGVAVLGYLPGNRLLVGAAKIAARDVEGVVAADAWSADRAIVPELKYMTADMASAFRGGVPVVVAVPADTDLEEMSSTLESSGASVSWAELTTSVGQIGIRVPPQRLSAVMESIRDVDRLVWADLQPPVRLRNSQSVWRCQTGTIGETAVFDHGLRGEGQVVGIIDTGLDIDHCQFRDDEHGLPALNDDSGIAVSPSHRKVMAVDFYWDADWPDPGPGSWDDQGHGSHVAGSVAGDEGADGQHQHVDGMAPAARLVIQDGGSAIDDCADLPGLGCPLRPLEPVLNQAYLQGARIHTNSWGDEENFRPFNRYTERTADVDRFVWNHRDFVVFFAGGNAGPGDDTVISPATGKNVVAVGATERGDMDPPCVASFSSRGWTRDGRIKPDLVVPGREILSAWSDRNIETGTCDTGPKSGTSMATPTAAGLAALVRQYFVEGHYPGRDPSRARAFEPSSALVKASLIASAVDLTTLGCGDHQPIPSRDQGWGLVQLDRVLYFPGAGFRLFVDDHREGFVTSDDAPVKYRLRVRARGPLKVVLVWTDPPSNSAAAINLVNDLDLVIDGPEGRYVGNQFAGGSSVLGGEPDRVNNVEVVWLPDATPGAWTFAVEPHRIAEAGQDFALVVTGQIIIRSTRHGRGARFERQPRGLGNDR